jgi:hypothetical protein
MEKVATVYLTNEKERCVARLRPVDESCTEVFLCAADLRACTDHAHVRELLIELAGEIAINRERAASDSTALRERTPISKVLAQRARPVDWAAFMPRARDPTI